MTAILLAELERQQSKARTAYVRFMTAGELLRRRGLSTSEGSKATAIQLEAFENLTHSLGQLHKLCSVLYPMGIQEPKRERAPRYSTDARRGLVRELGSTDLD